MKKLLFAIAFAFIALTSFSQDVEWLSYRNETGFWNTYTKKWDWQPMNQSRIPIHFIGMEIRLTNKDKSVYTLTISEGTKDEYDKEGVKRRVSTWFAYDKNNRKCKIRVTKFYSDEYDPLVLTVIYDDVCFRFYCMDDTIDKFRND